MKLLILAGAVALMGAQVQAQTTDTPAAAPAPATMTPGPATSAPAPATMTPPAAQATPAAPAMTKKTASHHMTLQQRFDAANASKDGHLTKDEATAAKWSYVTRNFSSMDKDKKGYVTVDDIHAFAHARHAMHKTAPAAAPATNG